MGEKQRAMMGLLQWYARRLDVLALNLQVYYPGDDDSDDDESDIDRVLDGLYIGGMRGALDEKGLRQKGITHVVNMASYRSRSSPRIPFSPYGHAHV